MDNISDNIVVEYKFMLDKFELDNQSDSNNIVYTCHIKNLNELSSNEHYEYENEIIHHELEENHENADQFINENNIITIYLQDMINNYLYDSLIDEVFENLQQLQDKLNIKTIDYNELNNKILNKINDSLEYIKSQFNNDNTDIFYFYLKYNKYTYYPEIQSIIDYIHNKLNSYQFTFNND